MEDTKTERFLSFLPEKSFRVFRLITWSYVLFLTLLLWVPEPKALIVHWEPGVKTASYSHILAFLLLGFLVELNRKKQSRFFWTTVLIGYALLTEIVQDMLPVRSFEIADLIQNFAGIFLGLWVGGLCRLVLSTLWSGYLICRNSFDRMMLWFSSATSDAHDVSAIPRFVASSQKVDEL